MSLAKLCGVGLAVLLTVLVGRSKADVIIEMDAASVTAVSGGTATVNSADYTLTSSGVTFNSNLPVTGKGIAVTMYVYADVLDINNNIGNYAQNTSQSGQTYLENINNQVLPNTQGTPNGDPFVNVGIQNAALSFSQTSNGSTVIPGLMTAGPNSAGFTFEHKSGSSTSTTPPNGIGYGSDVGTYFYVQSQSYDPNTADPGFSFLSYSSTNGSTSTGTQLNLLTINGKTYDQICLGKLTYTFTNSSTFAGNSVSVRRQPGPLGRRQQLFPVDGRWHGLRRFDGYRTRPRRDHQHHRAGGPYVSPAAPRPPRPRLL